MARPARHLSYANVMASIAVFVALGGTGYAAVSLSKNSVGSSQIRAGSVKAPEIATNAVRSSDVKNGALQAGDFAPGQLPAGAPGAVGPKGDAGPAGAAGSNGTDGAPGVSGYQQVTSPLYLNPVGDQTLGSATCPAGKTVIAGGVEGTGTEVQSVNASWPQNATTWKAIVNNNDPNPDPDPPGFYVYAICGVVG